MPRSPEQLRPSFRHTERVGVERFFWPNVIDILQTHDTEALRHKSLTVAAGAPNIDLPTFRDTMSKIRNAYKDKKPRKFTGNNEENHSLQVFLVAAEIIGLESLTTEKAQIALGHNLFEDTALPLDFDSKRVNDGIRILSHKRNGKTLYPHSRDKTEHFMDIIQANIQTEHAPSEILAIKLADVIVVGNDPLTRDELKDPENAELVGRWKKMTKNKEEEMVILQNLIPDEELGIHRRLREAIAFINLHQDPEAVIKLKAMQQARQAQERV